MLHYKLVLIVLFFVAKPLTVCCQSNEAIPTYSFGLIADIQYADVEKAGKRDYRSSLGKLSNTVAEFNKHPLSFVVSLGDVIDRDYQSFDKPMAILKQSKAKVHNIIGNHEYSIADEHKPKVKKRLGNKKGYYAFEKGGLLYVVVDGTDLSTMAYAEGSEKHRQGQEAYEKLKADGANNAYTWNGGIGRQQLDWLQKQLQRAAAKNKKVVLFCHWPLIPENGTQLWGNNQVKSLLEASGVVVAWISGHHHAGGYHQESNIHYLTVEGMVEAPVNIAGAIVDVYPDRLEVRGLGEQDSYTLAY